MVVDVVSSHFWTRVRLPASPPNVVIYERSRCSWLEGFAATSYFEEGCSRWA